MKRDSKKQIIDIVEKNGVLRPRDLDPIGIPREYLRRLHADGLLKRVGRGLYTLPDGDFSEYQTISEASKKVPNGVICLVSALQYHELTTQVSFSVWMAIERSAWLPRVDHINIRFFRFSKSSITEGVISKSINGVPVKIFNPAKTVTDCFKYRNKIGIDIAIEALKECIQFRKGTIDEIMRYAEICRVTNVIKPYIESII